MVTNLVDLHLFCRLLHTVEPQFNEWARDWKNMFAITWFCYIEGFSMHFTITEAENMVRYIEDFVSLRFVISRFYFITINTL